MRHNDPSITAHGMMQGQLETQPFLTMNLQDMGHTTERIAFPYHEPSGHGIHRPIPAVGFIVASGQSTHKIPHCAVFPGGHALLWKYILRPDLSMYVRSSTEAITATKTDANGEEQPVRIFALGHRFMQREGIRRSHSHTDLEDRE